MKMNLKGAFLALIMAGASVSGLQAGEVPAESGLVAQVGQIPVTRYEVQREFQKVLPLLGGFHGGVSREKREQIWEDAVAKLIERAFQVQYALTEEIGIADAAVEAPFQKVRERFGSEEEFGKALGGESVNAFRASIFRELLARKAEEVAVRSRVAVTDLEVEEYFEANRGRFMRPKAFRASHILVKVDPAAGDGERESSKARAEELAVRARSGEDFFNLAYYHSDDDTKFVGGDIGYFHQGRLAAPEVEAALLRTQVGEIAGPVESRFGFHVLKLTEVNPPRQLGLDEVRKKIRQALEKERLAALYREWMENLRSRFKVERFDWHGSSAEKDAG